MIVAERKPIDQIAEVIAPYQKVLVLGCGTCVTVCLSGGEKEAQELASALRLKTKKDKQEIQVEAFTIERQCEYEYVEQVKDRLDQYEVIVSMACGVGVQTITEKYPSLMVMPGLNTKFMGYPLEQGVWSERCLGCGDCVLHLTRGICPITRCAKSILNGPCGGSAEGKCELSPELDCAWHLIHERLSQMGRLADMNVIQPPKDWSTSHHGGPRTIVREDVRLDSGE